METLYLAQYWENDGGWHSGGYDLMPVKIIPAENGGEAIYIAQKYYEKRKKELNPRTDFDLLGVYKLNFGGKKIDIEKNKEIKIDSGKLEEKLAEMNSIGSIFSKNTIMGKIGN